jgi:cytochrome c oxidase assembly protein subunit 15
MASTRSDRIAALHRPSLAWFSGLGSAWVFVLVSLGAFTTSIGAGMAFPDWPLSNGSLNPQGWLHNLAMFAEHSHRLSGMTMGLITIGLVVWIFRVEQRGWLRKLVLVALAIVVIQGLLGGLRVVLNHWNPTESVMSIGQLLRIPHGVLAQIYVCVLIGVATGCSRTWVLGDLPDLSRHARFGWLCCGLLLLQLAIAATMRHCQAGLAIQQFPLSSPEGSWLPETWTFGVGIHFAHRVMALVLTGFLAAYVVRLQRDGAGSRHFVVGSWLLVGLLALQVFLGAQVIWQQREPLVTTSHVLNGSLLLALCFWLTLLCSRNRIEVKGDKA